MNVTLAPEFEELLNEKLQSGEYGSANEVIHAAMALFKERENDFAIIRRVNSGEALPFDNRFDARLAMLLEEAGQSGEPTEMTGKDWNEIEREAMLILQSRKSG